MHKSYEVRYHQVEKNHWWCVSRRDLIRKLLKNTRKNASILEVGCASGLLISELRKKGYTNVHGIDVSEKAIEICRQHKLPNCKVMDGTNTKFKPNSFDVIIASDVLEHIEKDSNALREWNRILKPGGKLLVFVPAHPFLWSKHDESNKHFRRYTVSRMRKLLVNTNFSEQRLSYWNMMLFAPALIIPALTKTVFRNAKVGRALKIPSVVNWTIAGLLCAENIISSKFNLPMGVSLFTIARKK